MKSIKNFSETLSEHKNHLQKVLQCFKKADFKLSPNKCRFCCSEAEYLGHVITPNGFKTVRNTEAVKEFPVLHYESLHNFWGR